MAGEPSVHLLVQVPSLCGCNAVIILSAAQACDRAPPCAFRCTQVFGDDAPLLQLLELTVVHLQVQAACCSVWHNEQTAQRATC